MREVRASDSDREGVVNLLRDHYTAGRLSDDELSGRVENAYSAQTLPELEALTADLPGRAVTAPGPSTPPARRYVTPAGRALRTSVRIHATVYALVNLMFVAIWAAGGGGYFWPIWPMLGWGIGLGAHAAPAIAGVGTRRARPPRPLPAPESGAELAAAAPDGTVTLLFSDIEGSTQLNERLGDVRWLELLRAHHGVVREQVRAHGGFEVKAQGDGFMIAFASARNAVQCARAIQAALATTLGDHRDGPIRVRIGLHTGEAIKEEADFYGKNVVLAARIAAHAAGGEIVASSVVKQLTESAGDIAFADERDVQLAGLLGSHRVYTVT